MYCCGPTVYDYGHIGNFRTFLHVDVLRRFLSQQGMPVQHVMNITDVDDKIIRNAAAAGMPIARVHRRSTRKRSSRTSTRWASSGPSIIARATEHIPEMVALIEKLAAQDIAYKAEDGSLVLPHRALSRVRQALARKTSAASQTAHASMSTSTRRTPPATSPCGRPPSPASTAGTRRSAAAAPAGTSSAPPWP